MGGKGGDGGNNDDRSSLSTELAYWDISPSGDSAEAASAVFEALRWAEGIEGAIRVYFPELEIYNVSVVGEVVEGEDEEDEYGDNNPLAHALRDRLTRAASGEIVETLI